MLITKVTDTHSHFVMHSALPQQQWLHEGSSVIHLRALAVLLLFMLFC
jgi:succinylarginine dihydrolase